MVNLILRNVMVIAYSAIFAHSLNVILRKQGQPYSVYLLITSAFLLCAAILGVIIDCVRFYGFYSLPLGILRECLGNIFIYAALFYALKFTIAITQGDRRKINLALFFLFLTYAVLLPSYILYQLYETQPINGVDFKKLFLLVYFIARIAFWGYYFSIIILQFHQYANKTDDALLTFRLRLIEIGCLLSIFYPFLAIVTRRWSWVDAVMAAIPYYIGYRTPKWLERKIALKTIKENMLDKCLFLLGILSEHYTSATCSSKSLLVDYVKAFGEFLRLSNDDIDVLVKASYFLDVGSMQLRRESGIESFQGEHQVVSADFAKMLLETERLAEIILHHHDRWDGQGRFNKAKGEEIPFGSRIIAIVNFFVSALVNGKDEVLAFLEVSKKAGTFFDPSLVERFSEFLKKQREGKW